MANNTVISTAARNAAMAAVTALIDAGGAGTIEIYDGTQPAGPGTAISTQNKLVTLTHAATSYATPSVGVATANAITSGSCAIAGTATWARHRSGGGTAVIDRTVGTSASDINLILIAMTVGQGVGLPSDTLTHPQ